MRGKLLLFSIFYFLFSFFVQNVEAARLYFVPQSGSLKIGETLHVNVYVSSVDEAMNAASGRVSFPSDKLEATSISKSGSIFSFWVKEPSISSEDGTVDFEGVVLNPGYIGSGAKIMTIYFKGKRSGAASLRFLSGSVLANDGNGTNILSDTGTAQLVIGDSDTPISADEEMTDYPAVSSPTHPDSEKWYANKNPRFDWFVPTNVIGINVLADQKSNTNPGTKSDGLFKTYTYKNVEDGIWYFHIRFQTADGWGPTAHFKFRIDTENPESLVIEQLEENYGRAKFYFTAEDKTSGIDYFSVSIDEGEELIWRDNGRGFYETDELESGLHLISVKAVDKAGNYIEKKLEFGVEGGVVTPKITTYPKRLTTKEILEVKGKSRSDYKVSFWIQPEDGEAESQLVRVNSQGGFTALYDEELIEGVYKIWVEAINKEGVRSRPSKKLIVVVEPPFLSQIDLRNPFLWLLISILLTIYCWHLHQRIKILESQLSRPGKR